MKGYNKTHPRSTTKAVSARRKARPATAEQKAKKMMLADLRRSGLTATDAKLMHCEVVDVPELNCKGYKLPYFDLEGRIRNDVWRVRLLNPPANKKKFRYFQAPGTPPAIYLPPFAPWPKIAADPNIPLYITEGEKKACAGVKSGLPTLGLGGVWSFRSAKRGIAFLADFDPFVWGNRPVYLVFDSDLSSNGHVQAALSSFAAELTNRKAIPYIIRLPNGPKGEKQGLDDFLVANGRAALHTLPKEEFAPTKALWEFNEEFAVIDNPSCIYSTKGNLIMTLQQFTLHTQPRTFTQTTTNSKGKAKIDVVRTSRAWLDWVGRRHHAKLTYQPGQDLITDAGAVNLWKPPTIIPKKPPKAKLELFFRLRDFLFHLIPEHIPWFEAWCAYPIQHPGTKLASGVIMQSIKQGVGKSLLGGMIGSTYGGNFGFVEHAQLDSAFNAWCKNKQFIVADEISGSDRRRDTDRLKNLITRQMIEINEKHIPQYVVPDCINYYLTSNHPDAVYIDEDDRRFFVVKITAPRLSDALYTRVGEWFRSGEAAQHLLWYLTQEVDVSGFNPHARPPMTDAKLDLQHYTRSAVEQWVAELAEDPDSVLCVDDVHPVRGDLFTAGDLAQIHEPGAAPGKGVAMGRALAKCERQIPQRRFGAIRLYIVRNQPKWENAEPAAVLKHYRTARGMPNIPLRVVEGGKP